MYSTHKIFTVHQLGSVGLQVKEPKRKQTRACVLFTWTSQGDTFSKYLVKLAGTYYFEFQFQSQLPLIMGVRQLSNAHLMGHFLSPLLLYLDLLCPAKRTRGQKVKLVIRQNEINKSSPFLSPSKKKKKKWQIMFAASRLWWQ